MGVRGCLTCRQRHLKCDKTETDIGGCLRCQRSGRECMPVPTPNKLGFRHGQNPSMQKDHKGPPKYGETELSFASDQVWVRVPQTVIFEDETVRTAADYEVLSGESPTSQTESLTRDTDSSLGHENKLSTKTMGRLATIGMNRLDTLSDRLATEANGASLDSGMNLLWPEPQIGNLKLDEAHLLRHFQLVLGPLLDVCDPQRHFSIEVVEKAPSCPLLLYACMAIAARHLSQTNGSMSRETADYYHERCISILLPMLEKPDFSHQIAVLLSSTVILRLFEQISSSTPANDMHRHLLAGSVYVSSKVDCAVSGGLPEAAFWMFVIQDIQFSLAYQTPLQLPFHAFNERLEQIWRDDTGVDLASDQSWTHKAVWLLAKTINSCYGADANIQGSITDREILKSEVLAWERVRPARFQPLFFVRHNPDQGRPFPTAWYMHSWHAAAIQYISIAKALLMTQNMRVSHMELSSSQSIRWAKESMNGHLDIVFGIALSATTTTIDEQCHGHCDHDIGGSSARIMACHALCTFRSFISDPAARNVLLDLLRTTERESGWPWRYIIEKLMDEWGMEKSRF